MLRQRSFKAAASAFESRWNCLQNESGVLSRGILRHQREEFLNAARDHTGVFPDPKMNLQNMGKTVFLLLGGDDAENSFCQCQLVHYLSRQLKQGSMLAMISPASATVLLRSMCGTVGVFLKLGTWMLMR